MRLGYHILTNGEKMLDKYSGQKIIVFSFIKVFSLFENGQKKCPKLKSADILFKILCL
jgi:hypothetical protein